MDSHNPVYALVVLVGLGWSNVKATSGRQNIHITTAEVPVRVESVGFYYDEVVLQ